MIEIKVDNKGVESRAVGNWETLTADFACITNTVYRQIWRGNPEAAELFRHAILLALVDPDSPVWDLKERSTEIFNDLSGVELGGVPS